MKLAPMKQEKLPLFMAAVVNRPRRERGLKLEYPEAVVRTNRIPGGRS